MQLLLNVGGPNRVSRVEMAETVAEIRGHNKSLIKRVSASSVCLALDLLYILQIVILSSIVFIIDQIIQYQHMIIELAHSLAPP